jgi:tetratricopeptide (TPR) repeat protein
VRAALELAGPEWPGRPRLLLQLGRAEASATGEGREALLEAAEALESSGEVELAAESRVLLALGGYLIGREDDLEEQLERATALVADAPVSTAKASVWSSRARHAYLAGRYEEACELASEALPMAESVGAADIRAEALLYLGCAKFDLGDGTGIGDARESLAVAKSINSALLINRVLNNLSILLRADGRVHESYEAAEEALAVAEHFGLRASLQFARGSLPFRHYEQGRWEVGLRAADAFLAPIAPGEHPGNMEGALLTRGMIRLARDDVAGALADTGAAVALTNNSMAVLPRYPAYMFHAYVLAASDAVDEARDTVRRLIAFRHESTGRFPFAGDAHIVWAWEHTGLLDVLGEEWSSARPTPWFAAAEAVARGDWARAVEIYEQTGSPSSIAFAKLQTGRDADLRAALDFFRAAGAPLYERQAEAQLAATA